MVSLHIASTALEITSFMLSTPQALRDVKAVLTALEYDERASYVIIHWQQSAGLASMCVH